MCYLTVEEVLEINAEAMGGRHALRDWMTRKFEGSEHSERAWRKPVHLPLAFLLEGLAG